MITTEINFKDFGTITDRADRVLNSYSVLKLGAETNSTGIYYGYEAMLIFIGKSV